MLEFQKEIERVGVIEDNIHEITNDYDKNRDEFVKTVKIAKSAESDLKNLITQGREKARLESTINRLEDEVVRMQDTIDELQSRDVTINEKHFTATKNYNNELQSKNDGINSLTKRLSSLQEAYDELSAKYDNYYRESDVQI